jgi:hypothetical protein
MERERLTDIFFIFGILKFEVNFGDFICVAITGMMDILSLLL